MPATKDPIRIGVKSWEDFRPEFDQWLARLNTRLDAQEGRSGTPTFYDTADMDGNRITNGPDNQTTAAESEFITRAFADRFYGPATVRAALQIGGSTPLQVTTLPGAIIVLGTPDRIPKYSTSTTLGDSAAWSVNSSTVGSVLQNIEIGTSAPVSIDSQPLWVERSLNQSTDMIVNNATSGTLSRTTLLLLAGGGPDMYFGVTSAGYSTIGGVGSSTGFIFTGVNTTNGFVLQTSAGPVIFQVAGTANVFQLTTDKAFQFTANGAAAAVGAAGTVRLRNNAGTVEVSNSGAAYSALMTVASNYWSRTADPQGGGRINITPTVLNDRLIVGFASSDITDNGTLIVNQSLYVISAIANASVGAISYDAGSATVLVGSGISGAGTYVPLNFWTSGLAQMSLTASSTNGQLLVGKLTSVDALRYRVEFEKNQNENTGLLIRNTTSGTLARANLTLRSGTGSTDLAFGVTSTAYSTIGGVPALTGFIYTGTGATNGLIIQTAAGNVQFQVAGTTTNFTLASTGLLTAGSFAGTGAALTALSAANISTGTLAIARGGTNAASYATATGLVYYDGSSLVTNSIMRYDGTNLVMASGSFQAANNGQGFIFGTTEGIANTVAGAYHAMVFYINSLAKFAIDDTNSATFTNTYLFFNGASTQIQAGAADSGGVGFRLLRITN